MPDPLFQSILCPILIGRDAQVAALARMLEQAQAGQGQIAIISGEAGIGKSRLVAETKQLALAQGWTVLQGACFEPDRTLPYALVRDLLRACSAEGALSVERLRLLADPRTGAQGLDDETKRHWFETLAATFVPTHPQILICEDLHWSDDASLDFLAFLARQVAQQPILLLLTYRPAEASHALTALLAQVDRLRLATEITLQPLTEQQTDRMVRTLFAQTQPIRSEFLYTLHSLSEGNPFFIEEILKSLVARGDIYQADGAWTRKPLAQLHIPRTVQAAVQNRLAVLSPQARRLAQLAAVMGRQFDFDVLQMVTGTDEATQIDLLKELIDAQLVIEETVDGFTFRHALTREAIYNELLQRERIRLHQSVGEAIEQLHPTAADNPSQPTAALSASLAYHFYTANLWEKARRYAKLAGEQALRLDAPRAAIVHWSHAIEAAQKLGQEPEQPLFYARGQAAERLGEFESARADYEAALTAARAALTPHAEWQSLLALGFLWTARSYHTANDYFQAALQVARRQGDPIALARTLNRVGNWYLNADEPQTALAYHQEALALLRQANDQPAIAETLDLLGTASYYSGDLAQALAYYQETITLCRALDQRATLVSALLLYAVASGPNYLHDTLVWPAPNPQAAVLAGDEALSLCRAMQWRPREAFVLAYLAWGKGACGAYARAFADAQTALTVAAEGEFHLTAAHLALALLYLDVGAVSSAQSHIETAQAMAERVGALLIRRFVDAAHARILIAQARLPEAEALLTRVCPATTPMQTPPQRLLWFAWVEYLLASRQPARALERVQALVAALPPHSERACIPALWLAAGEALAALRRFDEAEEHLQAACAETTAHATLPLLWRSQAALARLYRVQRRGEQAQQMSDAASAMVERLGDGIADEATRQALQQLAGTRLPSPKALTPRQQAKRAVGGLTAREREVAVRIAQGQANIEIADELTVSERTIESHVSNMLAKLGLVNRTQLAAWVVEQGQ